MHVKLYCFYYVQSNRVTLMVGLEYDKGPTKNILGNGKSCQ